MMPITSASTCIRAIQPFILRSVALVALTAALTGCVTSVTWYWATEKKNQSDSHKIRVAIKALSQEAGKPAFLVFEVSNIQGLEDGLYALTIPDGWQSSPMRTRPHSFPHILWLDSYLDIQAKPVAALTDTFPTRADLDTWIEAHRCQPRNCPYHIGPSGRKAHLSCDLGPGKVVILQEFDWPVRDELLEPSRLGVAAFLSLLTIPIDLLPVLLTVLLFRAWRKREPVLVTTTDKAACILHLLGFLVTAFFIGATGEWSLGWDVWGRLLGVTGERVYTVGSLVWIRFLVLIAACLLGLLVFRTKSGGVRSWRLAVVSSSLGLLAIPFGLETTPDTEIAWVQGVGFLAAGAAVFFAGQATRRGVRPLWVTLTTFVPAILMSLLTIYWAILTALCLIITPG